MPCQGRFSPLPCNGVGILGGTVQEDQRRSGGGWPEVQEQEGAEEQKNLQK
jgi:hypothetical protein